MKIAAKTFPSLYRISPALSNIAEKKEDRMLAASHASGGYNN
jgi:hypothetical protein